MLIIMVILTIRWAQACHDDDDDDDDASGDGDDNDDDDDDDDASGDDDDCDDDDFAGSETLTSWAQACHNQNSRPGTSRLGCA